MRVPKVLLPPFSQNLAKNCHFWSFWAKYLPLRSIVVPDQKIMGTRCLVGLLMWVPKLLLPPKIKIIRMFSQKTVIFGHIGLVGSFGALLVGGCGARAVSRKTPIYFMWSSQGSDLILSLPTYLLKCSKRGQGLSLIHKETFNWYFLIYTTIALLFFLEFL